jgi:hypothetical protein
MKLVWIALIVAALWAGMHYFDDLNRMSGGMLAPVASASNAQRPLATGLTPAAQPGD